jgi:uncharacterized protein DUF3768
MRSFAKLFDHFSDHSGGHDSWPPLHRIYYDIKCEFGSEDPGDPQKTTRVLTLMLGRILKRARVPQAERNVHWILVLAPRVVGAFFYVGQ